MSATESSPKIAVIGNLVDSRKGNRARIQEALVEEMSKLETPAI